MTASESKMEDMFREIDEELDAAEKEKHLEEEGNETSKDKGHESKSDLEEDIRKGVELKDQGGVLEIRRIWRMFGCL